MAQPQSALSRIASWALARMRVGALQKQFEDAEKSVEATREVIEKHIYPWLLVRDQFEFQPLVNAKNAAQELNVLIRKILDNASIKNRRVMLREVDFLLTRRPELLARLEGGLENNPNVSTPSQISEGLRDLANELIFWKDLPSAPLGDNLVQSLRSISGELTGLTAAIDARVQELIHQTLVMIQ